MNQEQYFKRGIEIVHTLTTFAYDAYLVGGVVRDYIMHNDFVDIDIATNATPDEVLAIFPNARTEYKDLGFVLLKEDDMVFEISTFKIEEYDKPRKPSKIYYAQDLVDDVKRRDFTVNALALTDTLKVVDLVKGQRDIRRKVVSVIGQAKKRFKEDPLRILRAYSLTSRFNFSIDYKTGRGIISTNKYLPELSNYQISKEIYKIVTSKYGQKAVRAMVNYHTDEHLKDYHEGLAVLSKNYKKFDTIEKFALCYAGAQGLPENTSFDKTMLSQIRDILEVCEKTKHFTKKDIETVTPKDVFDYGEKNLLSAVKINYYLYKKYPNLIHKVKKMAENLPIKSMADLQFHGSDLVELNGGNSGSYIKDIMDELASEVVLGMIHNDYRELKERANFLLENINRSKKPEVKEAPKKQEEKPNIYVTEPSRLSSEMANETKGLYRDPYVEEFREQQNKVEQNIETRQMDPFDEEPKVDVGIINLKVHYDMEFNNLVKNAIASISKGNESDEEFAALKASVEASVKEALLSQNPEYHILEQKGLI